jgi:hypothetical protein
MIFPTLIAAATLAPVWSVGQGMQLNWEGKDYAPIGLQCQANVQEIQEAMLAGIQDFNVEIPISSAWREVADQLEGRRFFLTVNSSMPSTKGITIQPQYYRINSVRNPGKIRLSLPGAERAYIVVALANSGEMLTQKMYPVKNGVLDADVNAVQEADQIILVYPIGESMEMEDLWERMDERRDQVLRQIRSLGKRDGLRGIINPLGSTPHLASQDSGFVPTSALFRKEFADYLQEKYRNVATAMSSWGMRAREVDDFIDLAKLVPLWNSGRGIGYFLDVDSGIATIGNNRNSRYWNDLAEAISKARTRRVSRLIRSIRKVAGVPIFQDWTGWSWFFENPNNELSGMSVRLSKFTPNSLLSATSMALSSNLRSQQPGPIFAVDVPLTPELSDPAVLADMSHYGVRGLFVRTKGSENLARLAKLSFNGIFERMNGFYFPQNASNPAYVQRIAGNLWWLPSPADGNRIDLGRDVSGYEYMENGNASYVIWNNGPRKQFNLRLNNPGSAVFRSLSGIALDVATTKTGIKIMLDPSPVLITNAAHCPVPESELLRVEREMANHIVQANEKKKDVSTDAYEFRGFRDLLSSNPQRALALGQKAHRRIGVILAGAVWAEYESSNHSFSEVIKDAGCSNGSCLNLRTPLGDATGIVQATVDIPQRFTGAMDVWIAARIPNLSDRQRLKFKIGGQTMTIQGEPITLYGSGFGWYKLGTTRLAAIKNPFRAEMIGNASTDLALDCVLFTPLPFQPLNVQLPEYSSPDPKPDPRKGSDGS